MKAFNGREFFQDKDPDSKKHEVILEDDESFFEHSDKPEEIWCGIKPEEAKKIVNFINNAPILGIDNNAVNTTHEFRDMLKKIMG